MLKKIKVDRFLYVGATVSSIPKLSRYRLKQDCFIFLSGPISYKICLRVSLEMRETGNEAGKSGSYRPNRKVCHRITEMVFSSIKTNEIFFHRDIRVSVFIKWEGTEELPSPTYTFIFLFMFRFLGYFFFLHITGDNVLKRFVRNGHSAKWKPADELFMRYVYCIKNLFILKHTFV